MHVLVSPPEYLWENNEGVVHRIPQGEVGEQGDALMPLLFALGQHEALQAVSRQLRPNERLFAFLDDTYLTTKPDRVGAGYAILEQELRVHACIRVHTGNSKIWNQAGVRPEVCDVLERIARVQDPTATVWKGSGLGTPFEEQGIKVLGSPVEHPAFVARQLERTSVKHQVLCDRIPLVEDVQSAWLLLHYTCAHANN